MQLAKTTIMKVNTAFYRPFAFFGRVDSGHFTPMGQFAFGPIPFYPLYILINSKKKCNNVIIDSKTSIYQLFRLLHYYYTLQLLLQKKCNTKRGGYSYYTFTLCFLPFITLLL